MKVLSGFVVGIIVGILIMNFCPRTREVVKEVPTPSAPKPVTITPTPTPKCEPVHPLSGFVNVKPLKVPPPLTNKSLLDFSFLTKIETECYIDGKKVEPCPKVRLKLNDGIHEFKLVIKDTRGCEIVSYPYRFTVDTTPPETYIEPVGFEKCTKEKHAKFRITASEPVSELLCKVDMSPWYRCGKLSFIEKLTHGRHNIYAVATDLAGNQDPTPASYSWYVDLKLPETFIKSHPPPTTSSQVAEFIFTSNEKHVKFLCSIDGGKWEECPQRFKVSVGKGKHIIQVKARDCAERLDETPAEFTWKVE